MKEDIVAEGLSATYDLADIEKALSGPFDQRSRALVRLLSGSWRKGWDECYEEVLVLLARYDMAHLIEHLDKRVH